MIGHEIGRLIINGEQRYIHTGGDPHAASSGLSRVPRSGEAFTRLSRADACSQQGGALEEQLPPECHVPHLPPLFPALWNFEAKPACPH